MSSLFKSFAGNPREAAAMAMVQSSSYRVCEKGYKDSFESVNLHLFLGNEKVIAFFLRKQ